MEFTSRTRQILRLMTESKDPVNKQEIAQQLGVSKRTVQREFEYLEFCIRRYSLRLVNHKGRGVELAGPEEGMQRLLEDLQDQKDTEGGSREERRKRLLFELLRERTPRKLFYYANLLGVSEATISSDMDALCGWLEKSRLGIIRRPGYGVIVEGTEQDYRAAMRLFIEDNIESEDLYGVGFPEEDALSDAFLNAANSGIYSLLETDTVKRVDVVLKGLKEPRIQQLADSAYAGLVIHISIVIERLRQGASLENIPPGMEGIEFWEDYDLAVRILTAMEEEFELSIPRGEVSYVLLHIRGAKIAYTGEELPVDESVGDEKLLSIIDRMTCVFDPDMADELKEDEEFIRGLIVHLRPVLVRLSSGMHIHNPVLEDIRTEYPEVFKACRRAADVIEEETGYPVNDEEVGFLAMHFGAAQERIRQQKAYTRKVIIGIVCASGFGVARLMMTRLQENIGDRAILKPYGKGEINPYIITATDFFVSTINLDQLPVDYLQVSPLIPPRDLEKIKYKMEDYSHIRRETGTDSNTKRLDDVFAMTRVIKGIIRRYKKMEIAENVRFRELLQFVSMQVTESLHAAADLRDGILERERSGSQIFPELGIALLHCKSAAVREPLFITCTPRGSGSFTNPYFRGIRAAVVMVMPVDDNQKMHGEILGSISGSFVTNERFLELVKHGREEEIRAELARELKCFFFDFLDKH